MPIVIYKVTRRGGKALAFEEREGVVFVDPVGLDNPQLGAVMGKKLVGYVRCEVGNGLAEIVGEASAEEVAGYEGMEEEGGGEEPEGPFRFPG